MRILRKKRAMQDQAARLRQAGKRLVFVPTMGYFHEGHLALMRWGRKKGDVLIVSIFVNPLQFGPKEDYQRYPRDEKRDLALARKEGVDFIFLPDEKEMYGENFATRVVPTGSLTKGLCAPFRPGHFEGVATVVLKLFHIVNPHIALFGQKDYQQYRIIEQMCQDLDFPVKLVLRPTCREPDGLALSSRNSYLSPSERKDAVCLYESLQHARTLFKQGIQDPHYLCEAMKEKIQKKAKIEYIEIVDRNTLLPVKKAEPGNVVALAVRIGTTRLIDNIFLEEK